MKGGRLVLVDWTRGAAHAGVFAESLRGWQLESELRLPARLAVRLEQAGDGLRVLAGEEAMTVRDDATTLIFENPARDLPRMDDAELQTLLLGGFWRALTKSLLERGLLREGEQAAGYVVPPANSPLPMLENFRASCASARPLRLVGSVHEAAALVLGFLRSEAFNLEESAPASALPVTVCLVLACDEQTVDVVCFDYALQSPKRHRILIRDCFQTTCVELTKRLRDCDWLGLFSLLVSLEDPTLPAQSQSALDASLQAIASGGVDLQVRRTTAASQFKLRGGAHIALCAAGRAPDEQEYDVAHACHIGLQIDQQHFQPIVDKDEWAQLKEFPHFAAQAFRQRGSLGNSLRLNLYSGYSTLVDDAVLLGHTMLWQEELAQLTGPTALAAALRLDSPGSGEFLLGLMPDNRTLRQQTFTLPGLVV
ncbi:MAG TPA: hypothetical protein VM911_23110 [Pyrinomonadaceae bacterium]|jgi:hypothetical protein|nr:hypothetical protein [Pyrinomonadaceae bacterium]